MSSKHNIQNFSSTFYLSSVLMGECSREETYLVIIEGYPDPAQLYHKCEEKAEYSTENICKTGKGREKEGGKLKSSFAPEETGWMFT